MAADYATTSDVSTTQFRELALEIRRGAQVRSARTRYSAQYTPELAIFCSKAAIFTNCSWKKARERGGCERKVYPRVHVSIVVHSVHGFPVSTYPDLLDGIAMHI